MGKVLKDNAILDIDARTNKARAEIIKLDESNKQLNSTIKTLEAEQAKLRAENKKGTEEWKRVNTALKQNREELNKNKARQQELRDEIGLEGKTISELRKELKRLTVARDKATPNTPEYKRFNDELEKTKARLKELRGGANQAGQSLQKGFGKSALARFGKVSIAVGAVTAALAGVRSAFINTIRTQLEFQAQMKKVQAITNATATDMNVLTKNAKDLGAATTFTATEVGQLQEEYAKLGFSTSEILQATESTLALAQAAGEDLAGSAQVAGATLRGFGLDAGEMSRVNDVMAKSFSSSALDLEKFRESMKFVAPIAKSAGVSIEETTAMLSALADAGISGSNAGTALRRILSDMSTEGKTAAEAIKDLAAEGITMTDAMDEVGRTAQTALLVLAENTEKTEELTGAYNDAAGSAKRMADIMVDNLAGDLEKAKSATEALQITIGEKLNETLRIAVQRFTELITVINKFLQRDDLSTQAEEFFDKIAGDTQVQKIDTIIKEINGYAGSIDIAARAMDRLNEAAEPNTELLQQQERVIFQNEIAIENYIVSLQALQDSGTDFSQTTEEQRKFLESYGFTVKEVTTQVQELAQATDEAATVSGTARAAALQEIRASELDAQQIFNELTEELEVNHQAVLAQIRQTASDRENALREEQLRKQQELLTARLMNEQEFAQKSAELFGNYLGTVAGINQQFNLSEEEAAEKRKESRKQFAKDLINQALDTLQAQVTIAITGLTIETIASAGVLAPKTLAQIAAIQAAFAGAKAFVSQFKEGNYTVTGAQDGKTYRNIPFIGSAKTGMLNRPSLVAEAGRELIVSNKDLRDPVVQSFVKPMVRYIQMGKPATVKQYQAGNVTDTQSVQTTELNTTSLENKIDQLIAITQSREIVLPIETLNEAQAKINTKNRRVTINLSE